MSLTMRFPQMAPYVASFVDVCHRLYTNGFVCAYDGNVSMRFDDLVLVTPTHLCKGMVKADDLIVVDLQGNQCFGERRASSELKVHLAIYNKKPECHAIVHAHPLYATAVYNRTRGVDTSCLMEAAMSLGNVPVVPFIEAGSQALADAVASAMTHDVQACVLEKHGVVTAHSDLLAAYFLLESLERLAKTEAIRAAMNLCD
ncbi:MAG: class II aldolase/adducin family protein [Peptococcaceae bacterium]|nr:class II aldolase/adducin family protein [Peptococcaceae bacterium]